MIVTNITNAKKTLFELVREVNSSHEPVLIK